MLETERLNVLFSLLEEMTQSKISDPKLAPSLIVQRLEKYPLIGSLPTALVFLVLVAWQRLGTTPPGFHDVLLVVYLLLVLLPFVSLVTVSASSFYVMWRHRKQPYSPMWITLENDLHRDAKWITQLLTFDKSTLDYGLLQYRHHWSSLEGRAAVLAGDLRKLGLFPAWAALSMAAATLRTEDGNLFVWSPMIAAAIFYLVAFVAFLSRERPQQVIQLLEYAIQHADQCYATPFDSKSPVQE